MKRFPWLTSLAGLLLSLAAGTAVAQDAAGNETRRAGYAHVEAY